MANIIIKQNTGHEVFIDCNFYYLEEYYNKYSSNIVKVVILDLNLVLDSTSITQFFASLHDSSLVDFLINSIVIRNIDEW